jgi:hypothetical protein
MEVLYARCCGLDVHKSSITACVLIAQAGKPLKHIRRFGSTTRELRELVAWLRDEHVAMESTGVYWKPVWNVLEGHFQIVLANAQHIKAVPGRKTDTKDCQQERRSAGCADLGAAGICQYCGEKAVFPAKKTFLKKLAPKARAVFPAAFGAFLQRTKLCRTYFTKILPFGSSVPCTRTRFPSNRATSV